MKNVRQLCATVVLICLLTFSVSAGQMTTLAPTPPPPPDSAVAEGQMSTGIAGQISTTESEASPVAPVTQLALSLWQTVLALF